MFLFKYFLFGSENLIKYKLAVKYNQLLCSRPNDGDSDTEEISVLEQNRKISSPAKPEYGDRGGYRAGKDSDIQRL